MGKCNGTHECFSGVALLVGVLLEGPQADSCRDKGPNRGFESI